MKWVTPRCIPMTDLADLEVDAQAIDDSRTALFIKIRKLWCDYNKQRCKKASVKTWRNKRVVHERLFKVHVI